MALTQISTQGIKDGTITNADINASAAIAGTKISPTFNSTVQLNIPVPSIEFNSTTHDNDFRIINYQGNFIVQDTDATANRFEIASDGTVNFLNNVNANSGLDVTGNTTFANGNRTLDLTLADSPTTGNVGCQFRAGAADFLGLAAGGGTDIGLVVDASNNVGIGITSPDEKLHVANTSGGASILIETNNSSGGNILFGDDASNTVGRVQYVHSDDSMRLFTASSERMRIDSSGKVGINIAGTDNTSPVRNLDIADSSGAILRLISSDDSLGANERVGEIEFFTDDDDGGHIGSFVKAIADPSDSFGRRTALLFGTQSAESQNAVERMRIDSFGNIRLPFANNSTGLRQKIQFVTEANFFDEVGYIAMDRTAVSSAPSDMVFATGTAGSATEKLRIDSSGDATFSRNLILEGGSNHAYPYIELHSSATSVRKWRIWNGQPWNPDALLIYDIDEDNTTLTIETNKLGINKGANSLTRNFEVGGTALITGNLEVSSGQITCGVHGTTGMQIINNGIFGTLHSANLTFRTVSSSRMVIDTNGNVGAPSGSNIHNASDIRLKKNITTLDKGLEAVKSLRPVSFNWIDGFCDDEKETLYGFIAQEVETVDSNLVQEFGNSSVTVEKRTIDSVLRVNEKFIIPMLVKAVQELTAKVEALETEVAALKAS